MSNKLPERPDFLKKNEETNNSTKSFPIKQDSELPPPIPTPDKPAMETPAELAPPEETPPVKKTKIKKPINWSSVFSNTLTVILALVAGYYYFESENYKNKYTSIDSRVLALTKEIASLNQENNQLSGKVVNYQKELEGVRQLEGSSETMQQSLVELENKNRDLQAKLDALSGSKPTEVVKPDSIPVGTAPVVSTPVIPTTTLTTTPSVGSTTVVSSPNPHTINYEPQMVNEKQKRCLNHFRSETLKRCTGRNPQFTTLGLVTREVDLNGQKVQKLVYRCEGPAGVKPLFFKYGPLEMNTNCANLK